MIDKKKALKINRHLSTAGSIAAAIIVVFSIIFIGVSNFTVDQEEYIKYYKIAENQTPVYAEIIDIYDRHVIGNTNFYFAVTEYNYCGKQEKGYVTLAYNDYLGKKIPVKRLPDGVYIRSTLILTKHFILSVKPFATVEMIVLLILIFSGILRRFL